MAMTCYLCTKDIDTTEMDGFGYLVDIDTNELKQFHTECVEVMEGVPA